MPLRCVISEKAASAIYAEAETSFVDKTHYVMKFGRPIIIRGNFAPALRETNYICI